MISLFARYIRHFLPILVLGMLAACASTQRSGAAPYAALVMDARTGEVLYEKNADARLHPASLTKMLTLYIAFEAIERGEISLDSMVTISKHAAAEPPSRLGLKPGQRVQLRYLIRAAAIKSANDAATAIGEAISGSEAKFAARMNRTAKALGMTQSSFKNANGLTTKGHLSSARDMSILGRRLFYDFPQYYHIFSRRSTDAGLAEVANTNRRFLDAYPGADGIKTGYTVAAGFNLTASAERGGVRLVATVFGGASTAQRNVKMAELLDMGFARANPNAASQPPGPPSYDAPPDEALVAELEGTGQEVAPGKTLRLQTAVATSQRPRARPGATAAATLPFAVASAPESTAPTTAEAAPTDGAVAAMADDIALALAEAGVEGATPEALPETLPEATPEMVAEVTATPASDEQTAPTVLAAAATLPFAVAEAPPVEPAAPTATVIHTVTPSAESASVVLASLAAPAPLATPEAAPEVVTRLSSAGGRHFGINIGRFDSRASAERALMQTMLTESATLASGLRKIQPRDGGYEANFMGLSQDEADLACARLQARGTQCFAISP